MRDLERKNMSHKPIPGGMYPRKKPDDPETRRWKIFRNALIWGIIITVVVLLFVLAAGHVI